MGRGTRAGDSNGSARKPGATTVGQAFDRRTLPLRARAALAAAIAQVTDEAFDDWALLVTELREARRREREADGATDEPLAGIGWAALAEQTSLADSLPERYVDRYSPVFLKHFALCLFTVAWKLAQPDWIRPACVAEELALRAIVRRAEGVLEMEGQPPFDFGDFEDMAFDDLDVEYLFTPALDGIDDSPVGDQLGMASLAFADWFRAFGGGAPPYSAVHPYASDDPAAVY
jgi:hypothetical protein